MKERLEDREQAWREGWLGELPMHDGHPACSRHDDTEDDAAARSLGGAGAAAGWLKD